MAGFCLMLAASLHALNYNNLRIDRFKWQKVETEHFDLYYAKSTELLVPHMARYLEILCPMLYPSTFVSGIP